VGRRLRREGNWARNWEREKEKEELKGTMAKEERRESVWVRRA
jgi:hypothetical protein